MARPYDRVVTEPYLPTAAEIAAACEEIQKTWDAAQRISRNQCQPEPWTAPRFTFDDGAENAFDRFRDVY